jgi:hypothetical protein
LTNLFGSSHEESRLQNRLLGAALIEAVLDEEISPRLALNRWPTSKDSSCHDGSLTAAYQALWHFESDEEKQQTEIFYLDAQLDLLKQMAKYLGQGKSLPEYLRVGYSSVGTEFYREKKLIPESMIQLKQCWQQLKTLWNTAFWLIPAFKPLPMEPFGSTTPPKAQTKHPTTQTHFSTFK